MWLRYLFRKKKEYLLLKQEKWRKSQIQKNASTTTTAVAAATSFQTNRFAQNKHNAISIILIFFFSSSITAITLFLFSGHKLFARYPKFMLWEKKRRKQMRIQTYIQETNQDVNIYVRKANRIGEPRKLNTNTNGRHSMRQKDRESEWVWADEKRWETGDEVDRMKLRMWLNERWKVFWSIQICERIIIGYMIIWRIDAAFFILVNFTFDPLLYMYCRQ